MNPTLKAVIYCRVSSQEQAENGTSLLSQEQACLQKASQLNAQVIRPAFRDEGVSGGTYVGRDGLQAALACLETKEANILLCYDVSRLSRDVEHHAIIERRVKQARAKIIYCTQDFADTADGELSAGILKQFAQWEKRKIRERTMSGHKRQAEQGKQPYRRLSPMGYHIVTKNEVLTGEYPVGTQGTYILLEDEATTVKEIFHRASAGASLNGIATWLNEMGYPTRQPTMKKRGNRDPERFWRCVTIRTILQNPVYKGVALIGRTEVVADESRRERGLKNGYYLRDREPDACIPINVPALVSEEVWENVQKRLADNKARISGRKSRRFVLSGLWCCPKCGRRGGVAHKNEKGHNYYCRDKQHCYPHSHGGLIAENAVYKMLRTLAHEPAILEVAFRAYLSDKGTSDNDNLKVTLTQELSKLQEKERATMKAQIEGIQAGADPTMYSEMFTELANQRKLLQQRLSVLEDLEDKPTYNPKDTSELFAKILADMEIALQSDELERAEKNALLATIIRAVTPLNREGDYKVDFFSLPGSGLTVHQTLS